MHPEDIEGLESTTEGERKVFRFLQEAARPDKDFIAWYAASWIGARNIFHPCLCRPGLVSNLFRSKTLKMYGLTIGKRNYIVPIFVATFPGGEEMKFVGVREFKQDAVKYLNEGSEIVIMKRKKPIARLVPVPEKSAEILVLEIGRIFNEAGITEKEALRALDLARKEIYG
jgi:antitoxin (DNA-binding transcriptional repressor) of toxin-antitoxin stability system